MRPFGSPAQLEQRRVHAIALFERGLPPVEVARKLNVDRRSVRRWKASHQKTGRNGILAKPAPGRPLKLDIRKRKRLENRLLKGAQSSGYPTDLWTCARVADMIERVFGVRYHLNHMGRLLRSMGWSPQKPERQARERDEAVVQRWIKVDWPRIKKKPAN